MEAGVSMGNAKPPPLSRACTTASGQGPGATCALDNGSSNKLRGRAPRGEARVVSNRPGGSHGPSVKT